MEPRDPTIGERIMLIRRRRGLTQRETSVPDKNHQMGNQAGWQYQAYGSAQRRRAASSAREEFGHRRPRRGSRYDRPPSVWGLGSAALHSTSRGDTR